MLASSEDILSYLYSLLTQVEGVVACVRNRGDLQEDEKPGIILLDGSEELITEVANQKSVKMPPALFKLKPEIIVILRQRDNSSNDTVDSQPAPIGPELSLWKGKVLLAVLNDPGLINLLGGPRGNGQIVYRSTETDMSWGSSLLGALRMSIELSYVWVPPTP